MNESSRPVFVEEVQWRTVLPWLRLFRSFRMAIHPPKLVLAIMLVVLMYLSGRVIDAAFGPQTNINAIEIFRADISDMPFHYEGKRLFSKSGDLAKTHGIFETALEFQLAAFDRMVNAATSFRFGFSELLHGPRSDRSTVAGALYEMIVITPQWLYTHHCGFMCIYGLTCLLLLGIFGGTISRLAALHATGCAISTIGALRFTIYKLFWFVLTPIFPLIVVGLIGLVMMAGGFAFFNAPVLDIIGGLIYFIALFCGLAVAVLLLLYVAGGHLFFPALAVEGTDTFDSVSRSFGYVIGRPWHWLFYTLVSIVYGAITYLFVGAVIFLALLATHYFVGHGVVREVAEGATTFETISQSPRLGQLIYVVDWDAPQGFTGRVTAGLIWTWVFLLTATLGGFAISFYYSSNTWIYLLLRKSSDGTPLDEIYIERTKSPDEVPEKVEPTEEDAADQGDTADNSETEEPKQDG